MKTRSILLITLALVLIAALALVACNGDNNGKDDHGGSPDPAIKHTVTYDANGGLFADGNEQYTEQINGGSKLTAPASPKRTYYTFAGWSKERNGSDMWKFDTDTVTADTTLYAKWTQKSAVVLSVDGASMDGDTIYMFVEHNTESVPLTDKVVCSNDSTWRLYYDKMGQQPIPTKVAAQMDGYLDNGSNVFYILVSSQNGAQENLYELTVYRSYEVPVRYYDGMQVIYTDSCYTGHEYETDYIPDITGYTFNYWEKNGLQYTSETIWDELDLTADKTAKKYDVTFDVNKGNALSEDNQSQTVTYDSTFKLPVPTRTGYSFTGWYSGSTQITSSNGSGLVAWNIPNSTKLTAHWQANEYGLTVKASNSSAGTVTGGGAYAYDSTVTLTAKTNAGYTWVGWFDGTTKLSDQLTFNYTMGLTRTITAKWSKATIACNNTSAGSVTSLTGKYSVGDTDTVTASTNAGYTFVGWYSGDDKVSDDLTYQVTMTDQDVTYTAKWIECPVTLAQNIENAGTVSGVETTILGEETTITAEINLGYTFVGWYKDGKQVTPDLQYTITITDEEVTYTAQFEMAKEMENFVFTSTPTTCVISGVIDFAVTDIVVPDYVTSIQRGALQNCKNLQSITLPFVGSTLGDTVITFFGYIFGAGFYSDNSRYVPSLLKKVILTNVTSIGSAAFYGCRSLTEITIPSSVTSIGEQAFDGCSGLQTVTFEGDSQLQSIGSMAFAGCSNLTEIIIPSGVTSIDSYAFAGCSNLTEIIIPSGVTSINLRVFERCSSLMEITIPSGVTSIDFLAFYGCSNLTEITIPSGVTSIGSLAFYGCSNLVTVYWNATNCTSAGSYSNPTFKDCSQLAQVVFGENVQTIPAYAFYSCSNLTEITIPSGVTIIGEGAFWSCSNLQTVTFEGDSQLQSIYSYVFHGCSSLTEITIPSSVTSIGDYTFYGCSSLTSIVIPSSVTSIGHGAFYGCSSLTIYCEAASKPTGWSSTWNHDNRPVEWNYKKQ